MRAVNPDVGEQWEEFVRDRYDPNKKKEEFRNYEDTTPGVREFYRLNHTNMTRNFVLSKKREYTPLDKKVMSVWEAMDQLDKLVDDSDPDTDLSQIDHNLQTAEACRRTCTPGHDPDARRSAASPGGAKDRATGRAAQQTGSIATEVLQQIEPDEGAIGGIGGFTQTGIRNPVGRRFSVDDIELAIDRVVLRIDRTIGAGGGLGCCSTRTEPCRARRHARLMIGRSTGGLCGTGAVGAARRRARAVLRKRGAHARQQHNGGEG